MLSINDWSMLAILPTVLVGGALGVFAYFFTGIDPLC